MLQCVYVPPVRVYRVISHHRLPQYQLFQLTVPMTHLLSSPRLSLLLPLQLTCSEALPASVKGGVFCLIWFSSCLVIEFFSTAKRLYLAHHLLSLGTGFPCVFFDTEPSAANKFLLCPSTNLSKSLFFIMRIFLSPFTFFAQCTVLLCCSKFLHPSKAQVQTSWPRWISPW